MSYYYIDSCPCRQGLVIVVKDKLTNQLMLSCDDCQLMWLNPKTFYDDDSDSSFSYYDVKVELDDNVSEEEIIEAGWDKYVKNMGNHI